MDNFWQVAGVLHLPLYEQLAFSSWKILAKIRYL